MQYMFSKFGVSHHSHRMKHQCVLLITVLMAIGFTAAYGEKSTNTPSSSTSTESVLQVTLELRDGSRIVGKSLDDPLLFHSTVLGNLKLPVEVIRSVEMTAEGNTARLTATNGDVINVVFSAPTLHVQTDFGKSELPVKLIRSFKVSAPVKNGQLPPGLVALWTGNGNGNDSVGTNNAIVPEGVICAPAKVGEGFSFDGNASGLTVPASPDLNVGVGSGLTLACWIAPTSVFTQEPLMEWAGNGGSYGAHFWISLHSEGFGGAGCLYANLVDTAGCYHFFVSPLNIVQAGIPQQVVLTYDKASGVGKMYYNGSLVSSVNLGSFTPMTDKELLIGERRHGGEDVHYQGLINNISIYNRALSASEIQSIYTISVQK
jgi:hypothetical protein